MTRVFADFMSQMMKTLGHSRGSVVFLQDKQTGDLVEILDPEALFDPEESAISARVQAGQEEQDSKPIHKSSLIFPSGEDLPRCWVDADYRKA